MNGYIDNVVYEFHDNVTTSIICTVAEYMFKIYRNWKRLNDERAILSCQIITKILFVSKHVSTDIQPTISFLMKIVQEPYEDGGKNIWCLLKSLHQNSNDLNLIHVVRNDIKGNTGAIISLGKGCATRISKNRKSIKPAPWKANLLDCTTPHQIWCGPNISWINKDSKLRIHPL